MSERILVTGAQGLVGRYLTAALLKEFPDSQIAGIGRSEISADSFTHTIQIKGGRIKAPLPADLCINNSNYKYYTIDTLNRIELNELIKAFLPTAIIHLASGLKGDSLNKLLDTNVLGTLNILLASKSYLKSIPFISVSSGSVYGFHPKAENLPFKETLERNPEDAYQFTKATEESIVKGFCEQFDIPWMILRVFNIVGPGQSERHVCGRFASELLKIKNGYKESTLEVSSLTSERDFVDVRDVANNIVRLLKTGKYSETYNICSSQPTLIKDVLECCLRLVFNDQKEKVIIRDASVYDSTQIDKNIGDNRKLLSVGGRIDFEINTSIKDIIDYYNSIYIQEHHIDAE